MKRLILMACASLSLALAGCGGVNNPEAQSTPGAVSDFADTVTVRGTQALVLAELAYNTAQSLAKAAVLTGRIRGEDASRVRGLNRTITAALVAGKAAQSAAERASEAGKAMVAIAELQSFIPPD